MPDKKSATNKGGRPARAPGEKLSRVNLSLRPVAMFGLELLARKTGKQSLSQAAEFAIERTLREIEVDGMSLYRIAADATALDRSPKWAEVQLGSAREFIAESEVISVMQSTGLWKIRHLPDELLNPEERYAKAVLDQAKLWVMPAGEDAGEIIRDGFVAGRDAAEVAKEISQKSTQEFHRRRALHEAKKK